MDGKRRCGYEGCRAWAQRAGDWCVAHPEGHPRKVGGAPRRNQNARKYGWFSGYVPVVALEQALDLPPGDLRLEIAVARAALSELLKAKLPPAEMAVTFDRVTAALTRLLRTNKVLEAAGSDMLHDVLGQVLDEMGT